MAPPLLIAWIVACHRAQVQASHLPAASCQPGTDHSGMDHGLHGGVHKRGVPPIMGFSSINQPSGGTPICGKPHMGSTKLSKHGPAFHEYFAFTTPWFSCFHERGRSSTNCTSSHLAEDLINEGRIPHSVSRALRHVRPRHSHVPWLARRRRNRKKKQGIGVS